MRHSVKENRLTSRVITDEEVIEAIEKSGRGWVIEDWDSVLGFAIGNAENGNIWALFVDTENESRGFGRRLHDEMTSWLWSRGLRRLWLTTEAGTRAQRFYESAGWQNRGFLPSGEILFELNAPDVRLRPSAAADLDFVTTLERQPDNRDHIGQWTEAEHLSAMAGENRRSHWIIERAGKPEGYLIAYDRRAEVAGIYVKRILVNGKGRGTGSEALRLFVEKTFAEGRAEFVWLLVRDGNERAQAVYRKLGFARFDPDDEEARRFNSAADTPNKSFRMILRKG